MKKMDYTEFQKRVSEVNKAVRIFTPLTDNISDAFRLYQEVLAEEQMDVFISTSFGGNRALSMVDEYDRPKCPECDTDLGLRLSPIDAAGKKWGTSWVCVSCQAEFYSEKSASEWMQELRRKDVSK